MLLGETYRIVRRMGGGGMGEVYEAAHERLAGRYAVKVIHADVRDHPEAVVRFMREAQITAGLRHPGIVRVIDFNTLPNGLPYLVMEYLEGQPLGRIIAQEGAFALPRVVELTNQIAAALTVAHRQGIVHRDLSPQNIFLAPPDGTEPERIKILDFGISKVGTHSKKITGTAVVLGTPQYMAPEQAEGRAAELDASSDQFSLAAIVYEMLTGRPAFSGETLASVAYQVVHATPVPVSRYRPELPPEIESVIARGLAKKREQRFASVSEFAVHLRWTASLADEGTSVGPNHAGGGLPLVNDVDETTAVSELPRGMASLLRRNDGAAPLILEEGDGEGEGDNQGIVDLSSRTSVSVSTLGNQVGETLHRGRAATSRLRLPAAIGAVCLGAAILVIALRPTSAGKEGSGDRAEARLAAEPVPLPAAAAPVAVSPPGERPMPALFVAPSARTPPGEPLAEPKAAALPETRGEPINHPRGPAKKLAARPGLAGREVRPPAAEAAPAGECWLTVGSYPWAELWVDGRDSGQHTPVVRLPINCGAHKLQFKRGDLQINQVVDVVLPPGRELKQHYQLGSSDFDD
jgi:serine/threonine protein kinase